MPNLAVRIRNWWRGYHGPASGGEVDDPPECQCGHYMFIHDRDGCTGFARDQWARIGPLRWSLPCRCVWRLHKVAAE